MTVAEPSRDETDDELRELVDEVLHHPASVQLLAYIEDEGGSAVTTPRRLRSWMTEGQFEYAMAKLEEADIIEVGYSDEDRYGARDPPRESTITRRGERFLEIARDEGYRTDLWRRAEEVRENKRDIDELSRRVERLEEVVDTEGVTQEEVVEHVEELEEFVHSWTKEAERVIHELWKSVEDEGGEEGEEEE